jgi:hypothetical protein
MGLEASLGLPGEAGAAAWLAARPAVETVANAAYVGLHVPVLAATLTWLYVTRPQAFAWTRTLFAATLALTVAGYTALPTAPPRLLPGFADGAAALYGAAARPSGGGAVNVLAAFPSGHVAFALVAALPVVRLARRPAVRLLAAAYPVLVAAMVVATAHHFWLDAAAAVAVVALAAAAAGAAGRAVPSWRWSPARRG